MTKLHMELEVTYVDKKNVAMILSFNISIPRCQTEAHIKKSCSPEPTTLEQSMAKQY